MVQKRFRALRIIGTFFKIFAWIALLGGALGGIALIVGGGVTSISATDQNSIARFVSGALVGSIGGLVLLIIGAIYFLVFYAIGDTIYLFLTIEENTRDTSLLLRQISQVSTQSTPPPGNP